MPREHALELSKVSRVSTRAVNDMPRRNAALLQKEVITEYVRQINPRSVFLLLGQLFGNTLAPDPNNIKVVTKGTGSEFIRVRKAKATRQFAEIMDVSQVPNELVAGVNFFITTDRFCGDADEKIMLPDQRTQFLVSSYKGTDGRYTYQWQYIGLPGTSIPGAILRPNMKVNIGVGNTKGEGSLNGNTLMDDGDRYTDTMNVMQITRYDLPETGSALADDTLKFTAIEDMNGNKIETEFITDLPIWAAQKHFMAVDKDLLFSQPNFNPWNKTISNLADTTRYRERPTYAGLYWWLDNCPFKWRVSRRDPLSKGVRMLEYMTNFGRNTMGVQSERWILMVSGTSREWAKDILEEALRLKNYQIQLVDPQNKIKIGFEVDEYYTRNGSIVLLDMDKAMRGWDTQWGEFEMDNYGGIGYGPRSNYAYLIPAVGNGNQKQGTIYYKEANGISRAFVMGRTEGITGAAGGLSGEAMLAMSEAGAQRMMNNDRLRLDTTADMRQTSFLSHLCPFMDTSLVQRLEITR